MDVFSYIFKAVSQTVLKHPRQSMICVPDFIPGHYCVLVEISVSGSNNCVHNQPGTMINKIITIVVGHAYTNGLKQGPIGRCALYVKQV